MVVGDDVGDSLGPADGDADEDGEAAGEDATGVGEALLTSGPLAVHAEAATKRAMTVR